MRSQTIGVELDTELHAAAALLVEDVAEIVRRILAGLVDPDPNIIDHRGVPRLAHIGSPRKKHHAAIRPHIQALEKTVAESVVAGQVVHALLAEHQQPVQAALAHGPAGRAAPFRELGLWKVDSHDSWFLSCSRGAD